MRVLVSDCLRGVACRFDGSSKSSRSVKRLCEKVEVVGVCPEIAAGLSVPRPPAEGPLVHALGEGEGRADLIR